MTSINVSRSLPLCTSRETKLTDFLNEFGESIDPCVLGAYFRVDLAILRKFEKDYQDDTRRQMREVIKYLLLNCSVDPELLWTTLTQACEAVQRIGHARLTNALSGKYHGEIADTKDQRVIQALKHAAKKERKCTKESSVVLLDSNVKRDILILGKNGQGKSSLGNRILNSPGHYFKINNMDLLQTHTGEAVVKSWSQSKTYQLKVYDQDGLFDTDVSTAMSSLFDTNDELHLNIVLFVMKQGYFFNTTAQQTLKVIMTMWPDIGSISALIVTHCERLSEKERREEVKKIKMKYPTIANFMKVGIITVGFPDQDYVRDEQSLADSTKRDAAVLRTLTYYSGERVTIGRSPSLKVLNEHRAKIQIAKSTSESKPAIIFRDTGRQPDQPGQSPPPGVFHAPPPTSAALSSEQSHDTQDECKSSKPEEGGMTDEAMAIKPANLVSTHGKKGHKKGFPRNFTSKISSLIKKFEKNPSSDGSSCSRKHPKPVVKDSETFTDGGKPLLPPKPGAASSNFIPFRRNPSPKPITAEPHPPGCSRYLHLAEQKPGYKTWHSPGRQLPPPAGLTSPKSEEIKRVQPEARHKRTSTLPRNYGRPNFPEPSPLSRRNHRRQSVKDLTKLFEEKSKDVGHTGVPETVRRKKQSTCKSAFTDGAAKVAEFDRYEVKHHLLSSIEWKESSVGDNVHKVAIYDTAESKWNKIAEHLGLKPDKIISIQDHHGIDDHGRVTVAFSEWLNNANQLPNRKKYPLKWSGLIQLLRDSELGQLAEDLRCALTAPVSNIKDNLYN